MRGIRPGLGGAGREQQNARRIIPRDLYSNKLFVWRIHPFFFKLFPFLRSFLFYPFSVSLFLQRECSIDLSSTLSANLSSICARGSLLIRATDLSRRVLMDILLRTLFFSRNLLIRVLTSPPVITHTRAEFFLRDVTKEPRRGIDIRRIPRIIRGEIIRICLSNVRNAHYQDVPLRY